MKLEDLKVGGVYFFSWQGFIIIEKITNKEISMKEISIRMSTGSEKVFIGYDTMSLNKFKERLLHPLKTYEEARDMQKDFETNIIFFLFRFSK